MKITFPHLGPVSLILDLTFREIGLETVIPPINGAETLRRGKEFAPEEMCLPFKYMMGNLIRAYENGAQRVLMPATIGPCRLGEYGELLKTILDQSGYSFQWVLLDTPKAIGMRAFLGRLKEGTEEKQVGTRQALQILVKSVYMMRRLDRLEAEIKEAAGWVQNPRECVKLLHHVRRKLSQAQHLEEGMQILNDMRKLLAVLPRKKNPDPVVVLLTGEIYTLIESAANQNLEEKLMLAGCSVKRPITVSWWLRRTILDSLPTLFYKKGQYLPYRIGGYAKESVEEITGKTGEQCDGVIKIMPAGCMPEIVAKAACGRITAERGTRILHLIYDEMSGKAGYDTRVEAFIDMLERRKHVLFRD